jgi:ATP adenylyltransferase/5',5'''-P-1,P-4-tetraphosphate phosphorylase II
MLVFYNGPRCGASAPDHFHFQACTSTGVPLLRQLPSDGRHRLQSFGRRLLVCSDRHAEKCVEFVGRVLECLPANDPEPLVNVLATHRGGRYLAVVWPRSKHRPDCYFEKGEARIAVSPAALEMAGILVVAEPDHFDRIDRQTAVSIYAEVSLESGEFERLAEGVT